MEVEVLKDIREELKELIPLGIGFLKKTPPLHPLSASYLLYIPNQHFFFPKWHRPTNPSR